MGATKQEEEEAIERNEEAIHQKDAPPDEIAELIHERDALKAKVDDLERKLCTFEKIVIFLKLIIRYFF